MVDTQQGQGGQQSPPIRDTSTTTEERGAPPEGTKGR